MGKGKKLKKREKKNRARFMLRLLNVRGLTDVKYGELEMKYLREGKEYNILCLTETQQKKEKVKIAEGLYNHTMMRVTNDKGEGAYR